MTYIIKHLPEVEELKKELEEHPNTIPSMKDLKGRREQPII